MQYNINTNIIISQENRSFIDIARRDQIIQKAIGVIAEEGYGRSSFVRIAKKAKISVGVISYHFKNKDELIDQIVFSIYNAASQHMLASIQSQNSARGALKAYIETNVDFISKHPIEMITLNEIILNFRDKDGKLRYDLNKEQPIITSLEGLLRSGQESGEFRAFDRRVMAITIRRAIDSLPPQLMANPAFDSAFYTRELVDLFDRATRKTES